MDLARDDPAFMEEAAVWCYRLILGREPESAGVVKEHAARFQSIEAMRLNFLGSEEFGTWTAAAKAQTPGAEVLRHFPPYHGTSEPGFWRDFLGVRTRCKYLGPEYAVLSGAVEGTPGTEAHPLHDPGEWVGTLRSVLEAEQRGALVVVELGAGWAPWLVGAAAAARKRGIRKVHLTGVEGSSDRYAFMWQHLKDNGIDPGEHKLIHAVMGVTDGRACFPVTDKPNEGYGAEADFSGHKSGSEAGNFEQVSCLTLTTLLGKLPPVDLLHCDIQGAEFDVMQAGADAMTRRVRRTVIGTHGREIEANLMDLFGDLGWTLENETACEIQLNTPGRPKLDKDGYQVWSNPAWRP